MTSSIKQMIQNTGIDDIYDVFNTALERYRELFPEWEISVVSIDKKYNRNQQIDRMIALLESIKD